ncbi:MAG: hypothetical protein IKW59_02120 [Clostridia bacterium]|nr:hypothetical protein [Clostridia bacterium]
MKRLLLLVLVFMLVLSTNVFADEISMGYAKKDFPESFVPVTKIMLFKKGQTLDETLASGWQNLDEKIDVEDFNIYTDDIDAFADKYLQILYKNPLLYYVENGFRYAYYSDGKIAYIVPSYTETNKTVINNTIAEIEKATDEVLWHIHGNMSDFDKIMTVHDYMTLNYEYDQSLKNHSITIMTTKTGVCESYARAFYHVMKKLGINCGYVTSVPMKHAWNIIELDGKWYHIDLTWDDPTLQKSDAYAQTNHTYALLSDKEISSQENPHYGYNLDGLAADSTAYDKAPWHGYGAIVFSGGVDYYVSGNNLVSSKGEIIYKNLDGGDGGWRLTQTTYLKEAMFANVSEYNGIIYFNTDMAIYSYNPKTKETKEVLSEIGLGGLFIEGNTLYYSKVDINTLQLKKAGTIKLGDICYKEPYYDNNELIVKVCKETTKPMCIFASGSDKIQSSKITGNGLTQIKFSKDSGEQTIFYWDENLTPLRDYEVIK